MHSNDDLLESFCNVFFHLVPFFSSARMIINKNKQRALNHAGDISLIFNFIRTMTKRSGDRNLKLVQVNDMLPGTHAHVGPYISYC